MNNEIKIGKMYKYPYDVNLRGEPAINYEIKTIMKAYTPFVVLEHITASVTAHWLKILAPDGSIAHVLCNKNYIKQIE